MKRLVSIDAYGGKLICPWHGLQDDDGNLLACGCRLETGVHGHMWAVKAANDIAGKVHQVATHFAATCETADETAIGLAVKPGESGTCKDVDSLAVNRNDGPQNQHNVQE